MNKKERDYDTMNRLVQIEKKLNEIYNYLFSANIRNRDFNLNNALAGQDILSPILPVTYSQDPTNYPIHPKDPIATPRQYPTIYPAASPYDPNNLPYTEYPEYDQIPEIQSREAYEEQRRQFYLAKEAYEKQNGQGTEASCRTKKED